MDHCRSKLMLSALLIRQVSQQSTRRTHGNLQVYLLAIRLHLRGIIPLSVMVKLGDHEGQWRS
eukprot:6103359-Prorocentrum_lima.AAC.1